MSEFKVGDRVEVTKDIYVEGLDGLTRPFINAGLRGEVDDVFEDGGDGFICTVLSDDGWPINFKRDELEVV